MKSGSDEPQQHVKEAEGIAEGQVQSGFDIRKDGQTLPIIPLKDTVLLPGSISPILLGRKASVVAAEIASEQTNSTVLLMLQKNPELEQVTPADLYTVGVCAKVSSITHLPNGVMKIMMESFGVLDVQEYIPGKTFMQAVTKTRYIEMPGKPFLLQKTLQKSFELFRQYVKESKEVPDEVLDTLQPNEEPILVLLGMLGYVETSAYQKQDVLEAPTLEEMALRVETILNAILDVSKIKRRMQSEVRQRMQKNQKDYMLNEELRLIHEELGQNAGSEDPEIKAIEKRIKEKNMPIVTQEKVLEELSRLPQLPPSSPEYSVVRSYIDWFLALPFAVYTQDHLELRKVKRTLNTHHFGLEKIKERILEHIAVLKLSKTGETPILCLVGPPGVGKTTLARSIAEALGRNYIRISLGGVRDESEIRGHRRTYIGSMPGRIVQALRRAKSMNPLVLLDEIDKMGGDFRGDPASALLEVLDKEQNHEFSDHYLETGIDLSRVLFITTANLEQSIPAPLKDRMEVVRLSGYFTWEKIEIAKDYVLPSLLIKNGLRSDQLVFDDGVIQKLIKEYTKEAGVRELSRLMDRLCRKRATEIVSHKKYDSIISLKSVEKYLGAPPYTRSPLYTGKRPGIVTGLAWTPVGGETLQIECTLLSGRGKISLTGTLGDVMKESAQIAMTLVRERLKQYGIDPTIVRQTDVHVHIPEGAIPKDGPSAGTGLTLALLSAFTKQALSAGIACTGEISLTGQVHAVGGIPEKILAAKEAGVKKIFVPEENRKNILGLPIKARSGIQFVYCSHLDDLTTVLFSKSSTPIKQ
jgi:ATP-dependent Lon protease